MRAQVNHVLVASALAALASAASIARAAEPAPGVSSDQWMPSLAITSGVTVQDHKASQQSYLVDGQSTPPGAVSTLRPFRDGKDQAVSPYVGGSLELMTPAVLPRLRLFAAFDVLPTFATERSIAHEGEPSRVRGPQLGSNGAPSVIAVEEDIHHWNTDPCPTQFCPRISNYAFSGNEANGQGMKTETQVEKLVFGARVGAAYSFQWRGRQMWLKPWVGWLEYKVAAKGFMVDATCSEVCTNIYDSSATTTPPNVQIEGHLRESILSGHDSGVFDGIGPGVELQMETGRLGPVGTALFVGFGAYYVPGDRDINFRATADYNDFFGQDSHVAIWNARVAPWIYRGGLGIRFQWLGSED
jgi:hypothetical protein